MNLAFLKHVNKEAAVRGFHRGVLLGKKVSPELLTGAGIAGSVVTVVMASKATLHLETVVDQHQYDVQDVKEQLRANLLQPHEYQKAMVKTHFVTASRICRLYGPAFSLGMASIGCILGAHGIMKKRNAALLSAYKMTESAFSKYRERVQAELGVDTERDLYNNVEETKEVKNKETGEVEVHKTYGGVPSQYAKFFDELNPNWQGVPEYNLMFLRTQQNYANDRLKMRGHLFLNEVYDSLGIERTKAGNLVGWVMQKGNPNGDNYVDFGIYDSSRPMVREFINGNEAAVLLDFNVDGVIIDLI